MSFRSYTIFVVIFRDQVPFERKPKDFDLNFEREGGSEVNEKLTMVFLTSKTHILMVLKKHNKR